MTSPERLSQWVNPHLSEARISAQWSRIAERTASPWWRRPVALVAAVGLVTVCAFGVVGTIRTHDVVPAPVALERENVDRDSVRLPEGITIEFRARSRWLLGERSPSLIRLSLVEGVADFDVVHQDGRRVVIAAPGLEIEVVGTRFRVTALGVRELPQVRVDVQRGSVRIRQTTNAGLSEPAQLVREGTSWAAGVTTSQANSVTSAGVPDAAMTPETLGPDASPDASADPGVRRVVPRATAKALFEEAEQARLQGRAGDAERLLERFSREYPGDARAGLVAFELGRLRMDVLMDTPRAIVALSDALRRGLGPEFREDAQARLVRLYARSGNTSACIRERKRYLEAFPEGRHVSAIGTLCRR